MMDLPPPQVEVYFVACHPAAGAHFADFYYELTKSGKVHCRVLACEKAKEELEKRKVPVIDFTLGKPLKEKPAGWYEALVSILCRGANCVICDVGSEFTANVQAKLANNSPSITRIAYYDNPEPFVPGGYSDTAAKVMKQAQIVLFANAKLANAALYTTGAHEIDLSGKKRIGLGYANLNDVAEVKTKRMPISHQLVYFGGANEVYYNQAFPRFLQIVNEASAIKDLSAYTIVLQQHPRACSEGNRDGLQLEEWKKSASPQAPQVAISTLPFNDALARADLALYYQTGAAAKFMLAGVRTAQIGHEPYEDILVKNKFCPAITSAKQFIELLDHPGNIGENITEEITSALGIDPAWPEKLLSAVK